MSYTSRTSILICVLFATTMGLWACGDDDSDGNSGDTSVSEDKLEDFVDTCADWQGQCVAAEGQEDNPAFRQSCQEDLDFHLENVSNPEACIDARLVQWECLTPCPEPDELVCVDEVAAANDACKPEDMQSDAPSGSDTPRVDQSDFVNACSNYIDVCNPDDGFSTEEDCENMWELDLANATNPGTCVDLRTDMWGCFAEEDCGEGPACMDDMVALGEHCAY